MMDGRRFLWSSLGLHLFLTCGVVVFGLLVRYDNAKKSTKHWFVGWVVFALCVGGFFVAGVCELLTTPCLPYWGGMAMGGLLMGIVSGNVIGRFVWRYYSKEIVSDEDTR